MIEEYSKHVREREELGVPPLPLDAGQTERLCELLSDPETGQRDLLVKLLEERLDVVRQADFIMTEALKRYDMMREVFQHLTIALPLGGKGKESIVLRPVFSEDVMTARFATLPWALINEVTTEICESDKVSDLFYDITHKPPATFGWE